MELHNSNGCDQVCLCGQDRWHSGEWHCLHVTSHAHRSNVSTAASAGFHGTAHNVTLYTFLDTPLLTRPRECRRSILCSAFLLLAGCPPLCGPQTSDLEATGILGPGFSTANPGAMAWFPLGSPRPDTGMESGEQNSPEKEEGVRTPTYRNLGAKIWGQSSEQGEKAEGAGA